MYYHNQQPTFFEGLLNSFISTRQKKNEEAKQASLWGDLAAQEQNINNVDTGGQTHYKDLTPQGSGLMQSAIQNTMPSTDFQKVPTSADIGVGLLSGKPQTPTAIPSAMPSVVPQNAPTAANFTNPIERYSKANNPMETSVSATLTPEQAKAKIRAQIPLAMKALAEKGYDISKVYPMLMQTANDKIAEFQSAYDKQVEQDNWTRFEAAKTPQEKIALAVKNKMPMEGVKMLLDPGVETSVQDLGGSKIIVGKNKYTGQYTNMMTGEPLTADDLKVTMTPYQTASLANQRYIHDTPSASTVYASNNRGGGSGGSNSEGKYVDVPGLGRMTPQQVLSAWKQASGGVVTTDNGYGGVTTKTVPPNPDILRILGPVVKQVRADLELPQIVENTGDPSIDQKIAAMREAGADEQTINNMVWEEQNKPTPEKKPSRVSYGITDSEYLGIPED